MSWKLEWHHNWPSAQTAAIESEWHERWVRSPRSHVFQQPGLSRLWVESVAQPRGERGILGVARSGSRMAYLPFTIAMSHGPVPIRELRALGGGLVFDYQDPFVDGDELTSQEWAAFWTDVYQSTTALPVERATISHLLLNGDKPFTGRTDPPRFDPATSAPYIDLRGRGSLEDLLALRPSKHRSMIRGKMREARALGATLMMYSGDNVGAALSAFRDMRSMYAEQHRGEPHLFLDPTAVTFYEKMIAAGLAEGWLHFSALLSNGAPISWHVGFLWQRRFYWYKPCYSPAARRLAPGHLHIAFLLQQGLENGWAAFDFTVGVEKYKLDWTSDARMVVRTNWFTPNWRGRALQILHRSSHWVRKVQGRMKGRLRSRPDGVA